MLFINGKNAAPARVGIVEFSLNSLLDPGAGLADPRRIRPESTPDPWAPAAAFRRHLGAPRGGREFARARGFLSTCLKGLVTEVLEFGWLPLEPTHTQELYLIDVLRNSAPFPEVLTSGSGSGGRGILVLQRRGKPHETVAVSDPECLLFPPAVFSSWPDVPEPLSGESSLAADIASTFAASPLASAAYLKLLEDLLGLPFESGYLPSWKGALADERLDLISEGVRAIGQDHLKPVAEFPVAISRTRLGRARVQIPALSVQELVCDEIVGLSRWEGGVSATVWPDYPVSVGNLSGIERDQTRLTHTAPPEYKLKLGAGGEIQRAPRVAELKKGTELAVAVWPDFERPGWSRHRIYFNLENASRSERDRWSMVPLTAELRPIALVGELATTTTARPDDVLELSARPAFFELRQDGKARGIFSVPFGNRVSGMDGAGSVKCALDFGTSNSAMAVETTTGPRAHAFASHWQVLFGKVSDVEQSFRDFFLSPPAFDRSFEVPSELVGREAALGVSIQEGSLGIPKPESELSLSIKSGRLLAGFKWSDSSLGATALTSALLETARGWYLRELLAELAAFVAKQSQWNGITLLASYPKAFDSHKALSYQTTLNELSRWLSRETGLSCQIGGYVDESTVAILAGTGTGVDCNLAIDVGGGTTDIAVSGPLVAAPGGGGAIAPDIRATSLRLAGHDVVSALAGRVAGGALDLSGYGDHEARVMRLLRFLRRDAREHAGKPWFGLEVGEPGKVVSILEDAFRAIGYFAMVQLAGFVLERQRFQQFGGGEKLRVKVHLSGNGWSLVGLFPETAASWGTDQVKWEGMWAVKWMVEGWNAIRAVEPSLPNVEFLTERLPGKKATVPKILVAGSSPTLGDAAILPTEVVGVELAELGHGAAAYTPLPYPERAHCRNVWALPEALRARLSAGKRDVEETANAILLANLRALTKEFHGAVPGSPITKAGTYLIGSPLRLLLENGEDGLRGRLR